MVAVIHDIGPARRLSICCKYTKALQTFRIQIARKTDKRNPKRKMVVAPLWAEPLLAMISNVSTDIVPVQRMKKEEFEV